MSSTNIFLIFIPILNILLLGINLTFAPHIPYTEKKFPFECGYSSFLGLNRIQFAISFFLFALLFLLFDLEILLVYPFVVSAYTNAIYGLVIMLIFFLALTLGFAFELGKNALKIDSRQMFLPLNNNTGVSVTHISGVKLTTKNPKTNKIQIINKKVKLKLEHSFPRDLKKKYLEVKEAKGIYLYTNTGRKILDASGGAAVSIVGHGNTRVKNAIIKQLNTGLTYYSPLIFTSKVHKDLCKLLIKTTDNKMAKVILCNTGSDANETLIKVSIQFYHEKKDKKRIFFIALVPSYHGALIGSLSLSGMPLRKGIYENWLMPNVHHIPACNPYRERLENETDEEFLNRKISELEAKFQELGPDRVVAFIIEPVVGAALGCVTHVPGYLEAAKKVCHKYGALIAFDEIMCGIGRTGTMHAWQAENVVPDIQTIAKGIGNGAQPIAAVLLSDKVAKTISDGSGILRHGQTYENMPITAAAAIEVLKILTEKDNKVLKNGAKQGLYLKESIINELSSHPHVGDIRGRGLFIGIEFVADKLTKESFNQELSISANLLNLALSDPYNIGFYPGSGTNDGYKGDHIMISPPATVRKHEIDLIVNRVSAVVRYYFNKNNF